MVDDELNKRIATLGRLVTDARELSDVMTYFHDELVPYPPFIGEGVRAVHKPLRQIVRGVANAYNFALPEEGTFLYLARFSLWHGALGDISGPMAILIYFDDQHRGVASFGKLSDPNTHHIRFSLPEEARHPDADIGKPQLVSVGIRGQRGSA